MERKSGNAGDKAGKWHEGERQVSNPGLKQRDRRSFLFTFSPTANFRIFELWEEVNREARGKHGGVHTRWGLVQDLVLSEAQMLI